ncbi:MAG: type II toxin-antitoxin system RelE/ParE family toxin [bacterium]
MKIKNGIDLQMPYARHLEGKLWELRISFGRIEYRVLYFARVKRRFVLLHIFKKKTRKTPRREIEIALWRMDELLDERREGER